jgi:hypothetical protein
VNIDHSNKTTFSPFLSRRTVPLIPKRPTKNIRDSCNLKSKKVTLSECYRFSSQNSVQLIILRPANHEIYELKGRGDRTLLSAGPLCRLCQGTVQYITALSLLTVLILCLRPSWFGTVQSIETTRCSHLGSQPKLVVVISSQNL